MKGRDRITAGGEHMKPETMPRFDYPEDRFSLARWKTARPATKLLWSFYDPRGLSLRLQSRDRTHNVGLNISQHELDTNSRGWRHVVAHGLRAMRRYMIKKHGRL
jgi:hypothetical protein